MFRVIVLLHPSCDTSSQWRVARRKRKPLEISQLRQHPAVVTLELIREVNSDSNYETPVVAPTHGAIGTASIFLKVRYHYQLQYIVIETMLGGKIEYKVLSC